MQNLYDSAGTCMKITRSNSSAAALAIFVANYIGNLNISRYKCMIDFYRINLAKYAKYILI